MGIPSPLLKTSPVKFRKFLQEIKGDVGLSAFHFTEIGSGDIYDTGGVFQRIAALFTVFPEFAVIYRLGMDLLDRSGGESIVGQNFFDQRHTHVFFDGILFYSSEQSYIVDVEDSVVVAAALGREEAGVFAS